MPELLEVEAYRRLVEAQGLGRRIGRVRAPDAWYLKEGLTPRALRDVLVGSALAGARRHGKLLLVEVAGGPALGLRFGMTGRVLVDDRPGVDDLVYSSNRAEPRWDRLVVGFEDGGSLRVRDPRRLGGVLLEPDLARLGPDASEIGLGELRAIVGRSRAPVKTRLLDQSRLAGLGNLMSDDVLYRAGLDPARVARSLDSSEVRRLHRAIRRTIDVLGRRGGSHTSDLHPERHPGGRCPKDGAELVRRTIGGRTSWSCPSHQR